LTVLVGARCPDLSLVADCLSKPPRLWVGF
jgi:hypothetical protein